MTWINPPFRMRTLGTSVRTENTEEVPSERTVQHCYVQPANHRMNHVDKQYTWEPFSTSGPCRYKG